MTVKAVFSEAQGKYELQFQCFMCKSWPHSDCSGWVLVQFTPGTDTGDMIFVFESSIYKQF